jgi:hypothetical protein
MTEQTPRIHSDRKFHIVAGGDRPPLSTPSLERRHEGAVPFDVQRGTPQSVPLHGQGPLPWPSSAKAILRSVAVTAQLLLTRRIHLPQRLVGTQLPFADGTSARVFRETTIDRAESQNPCLLVVHFRLRLLRGRWLKLFLWECILNTPLFVGFPGFVSKLWLDSDQHDSFRGLYEWDTPASAARYASSLWRVLGLVCPPRSIDYVVLPGLQRADVFEDPARLLPLDPAGDAWWRIVAPEEMPNPEG